MNILITGSSGFIGKAFVKRLVAEKKDYKIICAIRSSSKIDDLKDLEVKFVNFDLDDFNTFENALEGIDVVVHFAAHYDFHAARDILFSRNVEASRKLAEVCLAKKVKHYVYCSTTEVLGTVVNAAEDSEYLPDYVYGESKLEAEKVLLSMCREKGLPLTIARPTGVIGPGECYPFNDIIIALDRGLILLPRFIPGSGKGTVHWTYIDDVVQGFLKIIEKPDVSIGQIYNIVSDTPQTWNEVIKTIYENLGKSGRMIHIPVFLGKIGFFFFKIYYKFRGVDNFVLRGRTVHTLQTSRGYLNTKAKKDLGFNPKTDFHTGVKNSVKWLREKGRLK